jgi:phage tail sheath protein FI
MAASSYRFVSPGVQVQEIDNSIRTSDSAQTGPTVIGRFEKGPVMRPVYVNSFSQFLQTFGNPIPGNNGTDVWRDGNYLAPTYAAYAAQAWLRNTPALNVIRLVGVQHTNATDAGKAGWTTDNGYTANSAGGGAYGLFVYPSASAGTAVTGTLAAIWYVQSGSVQLKGFTAGSPLSLNQGTNLVVASAVGGSNSEFQAIITFPGGTYTSNFNFDKDSDKYIRKVFNTNPVLTNSDVTTSENLEHYWLGETFERSLLETFSTQTPSYNLGSANCYGFISALTNNTQDLRNHRIPARAAKTGYVIGQDLTTNTGSYVASSQQKLFRIATLDSGEYEQRNYKISIGDIKAPTNDFDDYGSFSVFVRSSQDNDIRPQLIEAFTNVNLNPASPNYIARIIGDKFVEWSDTDRRLREYGTYTNNSKYIRVEMNDDVDAGNIDPTYLPFGFFGPPRYKSFTLTSGSNPTIAAPVTGGFGPTFSAGTFAFTAANVTASIVFPTIPLVTSASYIGLSDPTNVFFGIRTDDGGANTEFTHAYYDLTRANTFTTYEFTSETYLENSFVFSLDDVSGSAAGTIGAVYVSGSRVAGTSLTAVSNSAGGYRGVLNAGYNAFTMPLFNGFDGFDATESEPLRNSLMSGTPTETTSYVYNTYKRAIDTCSDPETLVTDIVAVPGLTNTGLTNHLISTCEARADALAIIDLPNVYKPEAEGTATTRQSRYTGTATTAATALKGRGLNSSYGATYYPWVQVTDTVSNRVLFVPPSVVALGAMSYGQATQELWFAPAGFTRGGLSEGRGGIPVIGVSEKLSSKDRDTLYEANINPIAQFPAEGIVIFGQKTLQVTPSALDRINVRRMMIFVKREISRIASTLLFDQNVDVTWSKFTGQVNPFLATVKSRLGLSDYRVILDKTTTTPDLVDRNIMYAKIFLKPARAIEFIAIDFTITDSGASFID